jgi:hypothetical protein
LRTLWFAALQQNHLCCFPWFNLRYPKRSPRQGLSLPPFSPLFALPRARLISRFGEIAPNMDFIFNSLFLKHTGGHGPPVCEPVMGWRNAATVWRSSTANEAMYEKVHRMYCSVHCLI